MNSSDLALDRLDALEARAMHQDRLIEDLNAALTKQWRIIDALRRQVASLDERVEAGQASSAAVPEAPPPHY